MDESDKQIRGQQYLPATAHNAFAGSFLSILYVSTILSFAFFSCKYSQFPILFSS